MNMKSTFFGSMLMVVSLLLLPGCWSDHKECCGCPHEHEQKTTQAVQEKQKGLVIIDVLEADLYNKCHIKGAINVPFDQIENYALNNIDKDAEIILYCSNQWCTASAAACKTLRKAGFKNAYHLVGGIAQYYQEGGSVEGICAANKNEEGLPSYLTKKIEAPAQQKPKEDDAITAQELRQKMGNIK